MSGFKKAFKCHLYKGLNGTPCDCPAWTSIVETEIATGAIRTTNDCAFKLLPYMMVEVIKASNRPAAAVESTRKEIAQGFKNVTAALQGLPAQQPLLEQDDDAASPSQHPSG